MDLGKFIEKNAPKNRIALLVLLDILIIALSGFLALYIRFDFSISLMKESMRFVNYEFKYLPINIVVTILLFVFFKLYRSVWHFAGTTELLNVLSACTGSLIVQAIGVTLLGMRMPLSYYPIKFVLMTLFVGCLRFAYRILRVFHGKGLGAKKNQRKNVMIIGGGEAGDMIIKELQNSR